MKTPVARQLARFKENIDRPLAAILTLNTIAHTGGAIGVGAQASKIFGAGAVEFLGQSIISFEALVAGCMTLAILIFSEVIPKTIGANNWESLVPFTVRTLRIMIVVLNPFVWLSQLITSNLNNDKGKAVLSRADFLVLSGISNREGVIEDSEHQMINSLLRFRNVLVKDVMTPRPVMVSANELVTVRAFHDTNKPFPFSRIPIYQEQPDSVTGYVLKDEILEHLANGEDDLQLKAIKRSIIIVHGLLPIPELLNEFIERQEHIALVVDEFGGVEGIATMEDVIETLLGLEIVDESDSIKDMQVLARKNWEARAKRMGLITTVKGQPMADVTPSEPDEN